MSRDALSTELISEEGTQIHRPEPLFKRQRFVAIGGSVVLLVGACVLFGQQRSGSGFLSKDRAFTQLDELRQYGPVGGFPGEDRPCGSPIKYTFDKILHNNFGGVGPDSGEKTMRLETAKHDPSCDGRKEKCNQKYILEVHCMSEYEGTPHNHNGLNGTMATIGLKTGEHVDIEFRFFDLEGNPTSPETFPITWFDIDGEPDGSSREYVVPEGDFFPFLEEGALIDFEASPSVRGNNVRYISHPMSGLGPNPDNPYHLSLEQRRRVVGFEYKKPTKVRVTVGSMPGPEIRLFSFSMMSVLKPCPVYKQAPFNWWALLGTLAGLLLLCGLIALCMALCCKKWRYRYRLMDVPVPSAEKDRQDYAKQSLLTAFNAKDSWRYRCALELALDSDVRPSEIPMVLQLSKVLPSFRQLAVGSQDMRVEVQVCFVLDYTASMGTQVKDVLSCLKNITREVENVKVPGRPGAKVALSMSAIVYNDFDEKSEALSVPVVAAFGGRQMRHQLRTSTPSSFKLDGRFTQSPKELNDFLEQKLGHGGARPEELTGALIAASHLPWSADYRLCFVITDAPCHGKDYHDDAEDNFVDAKNGLSCSGRPEVPLRELQRSEVEVSVLHTGDIEKMLNKFKEVMPRLKEQKVAPSDTGDYVIKQIKERLMLQPLHYDLHMYDLDDPQSKTAPAPQHTVTIKSDVADSKDQKNYMTDKEGLIWFGFPKKDFSNRGILAKVQRPVDAQLDGWWTRDSKFTGVHPEFKENWTTSCDCAVKQ